MGHEILHIDMDAFFASVEQGDYPELKGKPLVVGSDSERGVVAAASYEARVYGVRSAMPCTVAKRLCPALIFRKHRMTRYKEVSENVFEVFHKYTDLVEGLSVDEAFLDVSDRVTDLDEAASVAREIKKVISDRTGLTCSAGVSVNKFLAKLASDIDKPDGLYIIYPGDIDAFIDKLTIEGFFGIGKVTAEKMHRFGIHTGHDLRKADLSFLKRNFGKAGSFYYDIARGIDKRAVNPGRERKSIGAELTFDRDLLTDFEIIAELYKLEKELWSRVEKQGKSGRTVTLKVKFDDFKQITRSRTLDRVVDSFKTLHAETTLMRKQINFRRKKVRLLGVSISNLGINSLQDEQMTLWE
ncbi:MAG: DNA polymerase IV [Bacteroidales bacterium]|nr:DNA polymerase IV [Bacteroidales bacterium]